MSDSASPRAPGCWSFPPSRPRYLADGLTAASASSTASLHSHEEGQPGRPTVEKEPENDRFYSYKKTAHS